MWHRVLWKLFKKENDYAIGLYIDADAAYKQFKKKLKTGEQAQAALLQSGATKTLRVVLAKENDMFQYVTLLCILRVLLVHSNSLVGVLFFKHARFPFSACLLPCACVV